MCREVVAILRRLKEQRDMSLNEVRLTVAIEDPRARERRLMGMEVRPGLDCMAHALLLHRALLEFRPLGPCHSTSCTAAQPLHPPAHPALAARVQDSSGISRDEMAGALMEVSEGRIPTDRIALRELWKEISQWPALDEPISEFGRMEGRGGVGLLAVSETAVSSHLIEQHPCGLLAAATSAGA